MLPIRSEKLILLEDFTAIYVFLIRDCTVTLRAKLSTPTLTSINLSIKAQGKLDIIREIDLAFVSKLRDVFLRRLSSYKLYRCTVQVTMPHHSKNRDT